MVAIVLIVAGITFDVLFDLGDLAVHVGVGLLVGTPFAAALAVAVLWRRSNLRAATFAVATLVVAALGIVAALATTGR
jgi:hypothetical protein